MSPCFFSDMVSFFIWSHFEFKFRGMMIFLCVLLVLCAVFPPSTCIKCFTCIGSVSIQRCLWTRSQRDPFQFIFHKRHTCLSTLGEREKECPPGVNYCELRFDFPCFYLIANSTFVQVSLNALPDFEMKITRLRIRNQNKYYYNRGRADGLSGWPQNYEVNFRGCGSPYQTQGKNLIQMCCNMTNCTTTKSFKKFISYLQMKLYWRHNLTDHCQIAGNTKGLKCKEGVLDGQMRLRWGSFIHLCLSRWSTCLI